MNVPRSDALRGRQPASTKLCACYRVPPPVRPALMMLAHLHRGEIYRDRAVGFGAARRRFRHQVDRAHRCRPTRDTTPASPKGDTPVTHCQHPCTPSAPGRTPMAHTSASPHYPSTIPVAPLSEIIPQDSLQQRTQPGHRSVCTHAATVGPGIASSHTRSSTERLFAARLTVRAFVESSNIGNNVLKLDDPCSIVTRYIEYHDINETRNTFHPNASGYLLIRPSGPRLRGDSILPGISLPVLDEPNLIDDILIVRSITGLLRSGNSWH
jgi:hypothetical protein